MLGANPLADPVKIDVPGAFVCKYTDIAGMTPSEADELPVSMRASAIQLQTAPARVQEDAPMAVARGPNSGSP
jgi:hypothetical protein